jgi:hypothetical protein
MADRFTCRIDDENSRHAAVADEPESAAHGSPLPDHGVEADWEVTESDIEKAQRWLDAWIAEHGMGWKDRDGVWVEPDSTVMYFPSVKDWNPTVNPAHFADVKREIERRGWSWQAYSPTHSNGYFRFAIYAAPDRALAQTIRKIGEEIAETEEIAGCLAFKQAVEGE